MIEYDKGDEVAGEGGWWVGSWIMIYKGKKTKGAQGLWVCKSIKILYIRIYNIIKITNIKQTHYKQVNEQSF